MLVCRPNSTAQILRSVRGKNVCSHFGLTANILKDFCVLVFSPNVYGFSWFADSLGLNVILGKNWIKTFCSGCFSYLFNKNVFFPPGLFFMLILDCVTSILCLKAEVLVEIMIDSTEKKQMCERWNNTVKLNLWQNKTKEKSL